MKKAGFSTILLAPLLLLVVNPAFAENIVTGDSYSEVNVNTNTSGSSTNQNTSNIRTHIEIETNGVKKVLDEEGPGNYTLSSDSEDGGESSVHVNNNSEDSEGEDDDSKDSTKSASEKEMQEKTTKAHQSFLNNLLNEIKNLFSNLFGNN